jgi:drug/metabolite transporter (DMT)-like permease
MNADRQPADQADHRHGALLVAAAALCWSAGGLLARLVDTDPWTTVFWRGIFCASFLFAVLLVRHGTSVLGVFRRVGPAGLAVALCLAIASTCFIVALARTSVANVLIIQSTGPFIAGLLGWAVMGERVKRRTWLGIAGAFLGTAIMVSGSRAAGTASGDLLALVVASVFAVGMVILRRHRDVAMLPAACVASALAAAAALTHAVPASVRPGDLAFLALFGAGQLGLGLILFTRGAPRIPVAEASLIAVLESVLGPVWVWLVIGERPGMRSLVGGVLVLLALGVHIGSDLVRGAWLQGRRYRFGRLRSGPSAHER